MITRLALNGLTLAQLRYFAAIADGGTFEDAAAVLGISQSALSQGIARLEGITGTRLLERDGRRRRITDTGALVADYARRVLGESETLANDLDARQSGTAGQLRVGLIDAAALYLLKERIAAFRHTHPELELSIIVAGSDDLEQALLDFRIDLAVVIGPTSRAESIPLLTEPLHVYRGQGSIADATWALYPAGSRTRAAIDSGLARAGIDPNVTVESGNPAVLRELAALTGSFTVLPTGVAGAVVELEPIMVNVAQREVLLATRTSRSASEVVGTFAAAMSS